MLITTASCSDDTDNFAQEGTPLQVNINTAAVKSRAIIESATLPDGHAVGLSLVDDGGSKYDNVSYQNIKATASTGKVPQTWTLEANMMMSATSGSLYGYYPYNSAVTDITQIPVTAGDTDYMYATPVQGLDNGNYNAAVTMNHALAAIRLNIVRGTYTGTGSVTAVSVKGDNIATAASLDAKTGVLTSFTGAGTAVSKTTAFTLSATPTRIDHIIVPVTGISAAPVFTVTMDGAEYTATPSVVTLQQGCIYQYTLKIDNNGISMAGIEVGDWEYSENGNLVIDAGYKITLAGNMEGIAVSNTINNDGSITIKAFSEIAWTRVNTATVSDGAVITQTTNEDTGILYITVTDITSDVTITFNGLYETHAGTLTPTNGVYIHDTDGYCHRLEDWDGKYYTPNGVAVVTDGCSFVMALQDVGSSLLWGGYGISVTGIMTTTIVNTAKTDFVGETNTTQIVNQLKGKTDKAGKVGAPAAEACQAYFFPNGQMGYLPAFGELQVAYNYKNDINLLLRTLSVGIEMASGWYWSSTQVNATNSHALNFGTGGTYLYDKASGVNVRPFMKLDIQNP